jgi:hypothetical protein
VSSLPIILNFDDPKKIQSFLKNIVDNSHENSSNPIT